LIKIEARNGEIVFSIEGVEFFLSEPMETLEVQLISKTKAVRIWNLKNEG